MKVFISHSLEDRGYVRQLTAELKKHGIGVLHADPLAGTSIEQSLEKAMRAADVGVFLLTPAFVNNPNLIFAAGATVGMGKPMIPVIERSLEKRPLPFSLMAERYLVRDSAKETAKNIADALKVAA